MTRKLLFICGKNKRRSPTAEHLFASLNEVETASAGVSRDADVFVTPELLAWADLILTMERAHGAKLKKLFNSYLRGKRVVCLNIPDDFEYMAPELVVLLKDRVPPQLS
ncbi:MAG: hypothetical protein QM811_26220 [Pirellulales bacterium]